MTHFTRSVTRVALAGAFVILFAGSLYAQAQIPGPWPTNWSTCACSPQSSDAFQIFYDPWATTCTIPDAALRLNVGTACSEPIFGQLGVVDSLHDPFFSMHATEWFSAFAPLSATVLRSSQGDLVLSATTSSTTPTKGPTPPLTASIRFGTTPSDTLSSTAEKPAESERMVITGNGNVGIDVPPMADGLDSASDQIQIGGGTIPPPAPWYTGYTTPIPGLTIYGGNRYEGMMRTDTALPMPVDWRGLAFNHWEDHKTGYAARFEPMPWDQIAFGDEDGGLISLGVFPWHTGDSLTSNDSGVYFQLTGQQGLSMYCYEGASDPYHHLFDVWRPGFLAWPITRNVNGLFFHNTPVYIGLGEEDFTNFKNVHPDIGDDSTWMLAVNGAALAKEFFVLDTVWADYVFQPGYKLMPIADLDRYVEIHHHLPGIPSASQIAKTGVPIGRTEAALTKNVEELTLRTIQLSKQNQQLAEQNDELNERLQKLETEFLKLKEQGGK